jgi:hypothetical protein
MGDHFTANFAEAAQPVRDSQKTIVSHGSNIAGGIPPILQNRAGFFRASQISLHHIWSAHQKHARRVRWQWLSSLRIDNSDAHAR